MRFLKREWPHLLVLAVMFSASWWAWGWAPERVPSHWGLDGQPDGWSGRGVGLFGIPVLAIGMWALMRWLPRLDPSYANYAAFDGPYGLIRLAILCTLALLHGCILTNLRGQGPDMARVAPIVVGLPLVVIGAVLPGLRPNWFVGIRTPWTLSSVRSWERTHRTGRWVFVALGVMLILTGLSRLALMLWATVALGAVGMIALVVQSYTEWKQDPQKSPPFGSRPEAR